MKTSPFIYGVTVSTNAFTNREIETKKLKSNLTGGINTMIISPRRWGKSSLVEKVIFDINKNNLTYKTVIMDLFSVSSKEEFLEVFNVDVSGLGRGVYFIHLSSEKGMVVRRFLKE